MKLVAAWPACLWSVQTKTKKAKMKAAASASGEDNDSDMIPVSSIWWVFLSRATRQVLPTYRPHPLCTLLTRESLGKGLTPPRNQQCKNHDHALDCTHHVVTQQHFCRVLVDLLGWIHLQLSAKRFVNVRTFNGKVLVDIREYYTDDSGERKPGRKGQYCVVSECTVY